MGLLLSILVTCVGVVELLTFYHNVKTRANSHPVQADLRSVRDQYLKDLEDVRDRLIVQLHTIKNGENNSAPVNIPTLRLNSHDHVDVEFNERSQSTSPRRFLDAEKKSPSSSPTRRFVVAEEPQALQGIKKSKAQECVPEYLIEDQPASSVPINILKDDNRSVSLPSPEKILVSEYEKEGKTDVFRKKLGYNIVEVDGELYFRRSPSPFPSFDLTVPRNSVCSEFLDNSVSVAEVDELSRSNSQSPVNVKKGFELNNNLEINNNSEKVDVILTSSTHNSRNYWNNKVLVLPQKKSESSSLCSEIFKQPNEDGLVKSGSLELTSNLYTCSESASNFNLSQINSNGLASESEDDEFFEVQMYTEAAKNSLDGIDRSKGCIKKKIIKRKRIKNRPTATSGNKSGANSSIEPFVCPIEKNAITGNICENTSKAKAGEPFWVNRQT